MRISDWSSDVGSSDLALLGSRVPLGMKLLLSTIAVVDDLIAIVIIAVFYTHDMSVPALGWAAAAIAAMAILNWRGVTALTPYLLLHRKSVGSGQSGSGRVDVGGRVTLNKKT